MGSGDLFGKGKKHDLALASMEEAARRLGLEIRYENLKDDDINISSGVCTVKNRRLLIIDRRLDDASKWKMIARTLTSMNVDDAYLPPLARELIEEMRNRP